MNCFYCIFPIPSHKPKPVAKYRVPLTSRSIEQILVVLLFVVFMLPCNQKKVETESEQVVMVEFDSTYLAMNPMDLEFDSLE